MPCNKPSGGTTSSAFVVLQYLHKHHIRSRRRASGRSPPRVPGAPREIPDAARPWVGHAPQGVGRPQCTRPRGPHQSLNRSRSQLKAHLRSHGHANRVCSDWNAAIGVEDPEAGFVGHYNESTTSKYSSISEGENVQNGHNSEMTSDFEVSSTSGDET